MKRLMQKLNIQILYNSTCMGTWRQKVFNTMVFCQGFQGGGKRESVLNEGTGLYVAVMKFWKWMLVIVAKLNMYNTELNIKITKNNDH